MTQVSEQAKRVFPGSDWAMATPESQGVDSRRLEAAMAKLKEITDAKTHEVTHHDGISQVMVIRHGYLIWHGPAIDTVHECWSCTKTFPSLCMGLLTDDGKLSPDTLAADILSAMRERYPTVTLRMMAGFTSGYRGREEGDTPAIFEPGEPNFAPGTHLHYSQETDQLSRLLTRVAGEPLRDLFRRRGGTNTWAAGIIASCFPPLSTSRRPVFSPTHASSSSLSNSRMTRKSRSGSTGLPRWRS